MDLFSFLKDSYSSLYKASNVYSYDAFNKIFRGLLAGSNLCPFKICFQPLNKTQARFLLTKILLSSLLTQNPWRKEPKPNIYHKVKISSFVLTVFELTIAKKSSEGRLILQLLKDKHVSLIISFILNLHSQK